jgi:hypothetical protein
LNDALLVSIEVRKRSDLLRASKEEVVAVTGVWAPE